MPGGIVVHLSKGEVENSLEKPADNLKPAENSPRGSHPPMYARAAWPRCRMIKSAMRRAGSAFPLCKHKRGGPISVEVLDSEHAFSHVE